MARFRSIICGFAFAAASLSMAAAQSTRPVFPRPIPKPPQLTPSQQTPPQQAPPAVNRPAPANPQTAPVNPQTAPVNPQTAPIKPSPTADPANNNAPALPVTPPQVSYRDGMLTVQASNSTLSSVLSAIRNKTGIEFEGLEGASDHVALSVGPAPAGEVLSSIFQGSRFDFVAIGRSDDPSIVQRVIMTPKGQPGAVAGAQQPQPRPNDNGEGNGGEDENPDEQVNVEPQDTPAQPPQVQPQPEPQPQPQPEQPKTEQQIYQELLEMRKRQQMQQEGAPPPNPASVPRKPPL